MMWESGKSKPVLKVNRSGEVMAKYRSAGEAAIKNNMSVNSVANRCNGKVKKEYDENGFSYIWGEMT